MGIGLGSFLSDQLHGLIGGLSLTHQETGCHGDTPVASFPAVHQDAITMLHHRQCGLYTPHEQPDRNGQKNRIKRAQGEHAEGRLAINLCRPEKDHVQDQAHVHRLDRIRLVGFWMGSDVKLVGNLGDVHV